MIVQIGTLVISVILAVAFYIILAVGLLTARDIITPLVLIVIAITCLAIFSTLSKIEYDIRRQTGRRRRK